MKTCPMLALYAGCLILAMAAIFHSVFPPLAGFLLQVPHG